MKTLAYRLSIALAAQRIHTRMIRQAQREQCSAQALDAYRASAAVYNRLLSAALDALRRARAADPALHNAIEAIDAQQPDRLRKIRDAVDKG